MVTKRATKKTPAKKVVRPEIKNVRNYELIYVIRPDVTDDNLEPVIEKVNTLITSKGGTLSGTEKWGKRKLSYPIKHFQEGTYILSKFQGPPKASQEIESNLQISEEILRFMVVQAK